MRNYRRYPEYKDSGIEWLGQIPAHWQVGKYARYFRSAMGQTILREDLVDDGEVPVYSATESGAMFGRIDNANAVVELDAGDIVIPARGVSIGHAILIKEPSTCTQTTIYSKLTDTRRVHPAYVQYFMLGCRQVLFYYDRTAIPQITVDQVKSNPLLIPPLQEQQTIADFLDRETAKIDALIEKKERLIELLQEKRTALITHAVTKGLDPNATMKDSGIEWLGRIPAHWKLKRLKHILSEPLKYGANEAAELDDPELPRYVRITDIDDSDRLRDETFRSLPREVAEPYLLQEGDLLLARSGATVGKTFLYRASWGECAYAGYLIRARLDLEQVLPLFIRYYTASSVYWQWLSSAFIQATIQNVSAEKYAELWVPLPTVREQEAILGFLDRETAKIDALVGKVQEAIERLREYRTALISAAVTGKIDVR